MNDTGHSLELSPSAARRIDRTCDRFEAAWKTRRPSPEDYLGSATEPERSVLLRQLLLVDWDYRQRLGESPRAGDYHARFPGDRGMIDDVDREMAEESVSTRVDSQHPGTPHTAWSGGPTTGRTANGIDTDGVAGRTGNTSLAHPGADRYDLLVEVGHGGIGVVFRGRDRHLGRDLAIKVLHENYRDHPDALCRFMAEARVGSQLQHPSIVPVYEQGWFADRRPYLTMKLVEGHTLAKLLCDRTDPGHDLPRLLAVFAPVCQAMAYAHAQGVVHRDLKPANVMVGAFGEVQVMDWGFAKVLGADQAAGHRTARVVSENGAIMGTPAYMPPEQARGEADLIDARADVFALGAILCEILTGRPPYVAGSGDDVCRKAAAADLADAHARLDASGADAALRALARRCIAAERSDRPSDAGMVVRDLTDYLNAAQERLRQAQLDRAAAQARAQEAAAKAKAEWRARRLTLALAAVLLIGTALAAWQAIVATRAQTDALTATAEAVEARDRAKANLYHALVGEIRATRTARGVGYRRRVWELLEQARGIDTAEFDPVVLRQEAVGCLGDFTGLPPAEQPAFPARISALAIRPGTEEIAWGLENGMILLRHWLTGAESARLAAPRAAVMALAFAPDGRRLVSVDADGAITVREMGQDGWGAARAVGDAPYPQPLPGAKPRPRQAHVLRGGRYLAVPAGAIVTTWDLDGGSKAPSFAADTSIGEVALSADGTELIGTTDAGLIVWEVASRRIVRRVPLTGGAEHLAVSANGRFLAYSDGETGLIVLDAKTYQQRTMRRGGEVNQLAFDTDGSFLAATSWQDHTVPIWDVLANEMVARLPFADAPQLLAFSADRRTLVVAGRDRARTWDLRAADEKRSWHVHADGVCGVIFSPDGKRLVSTSHDRTAIVWDVATGQPQLKLTGFRGAVETAAFSPDGRLLATADRDGPVRLWMADSGADLGVIPDFPWPQTYHVEFSSNGEYLAATGDGLAVWRCAPDPSQPGGLSLKRVASVAGSFSLHAAFSPDGRWLAWVDKGKKVRVWDLAHGREAPCRVPDLLAAGWHSLVFQPGRSHLLYFVSRTGQLTGWDVEKNAEDRPDALSGLYATVERRPMELSLLNAHGVEVISLPRERSTIWQRAWSPNGSLLAVGLSSGELVVWDIDRVRARLADLGLAP